MPRLAASVTMMFNEWPLLDRFEQAARAGFEGVEIQDPYAESKESLAGRVRAHGLVPALMNVAPAAGAVPGREAEYRAGVARAIEYAALSGCRQLHCLAGCSDAPRAEATFVANLKWAAAAAPAGMRLLIEPLNTRDNPGYFLTGSAQARRILERVGADNVRLQYDFYHMQIMEGALAATVRANIDVIAHFQVGGVPGRHEPNQAQEVNYPYLFDLIDDLGFRGWVGCDYRPAAGTLEGLRWARPYGIAPAPAGRPA
jgi:hydroxypyruvate isomerase